MDNQLLKALEISVGIIMLFLGLSTSFQIFRSTEHLIDRMVEYEQYNYEYASIDMIVDIKNTAEKPEIYYTLLRGDVREVVIDGMYVQTYQELIQSHEPYNARLMIRDTVNNLTDKQFDVLYYYNDEGFIQKIVYE